MLPWQQKSEINFVKKKLFISYCVWILYMSFCKILFHILWLSLEINSVYDVAV